ncbi:hypothetical protein [Orbus mooreae]|uniref:hypothetical protein n=1 Tax=Orbus mooreae TaxID=3074107 RepID=UPI00370D22C2
MKASSLKNTNLQVRQQSVKLDRVSLPSFSNLTNLGLLTITLPFISLSSYATLSTMTSQTIQGTAPYFVLNRMVLTSTDEILGFSYKTTDGETAFANAAQASSTITVNAYMKENELVALVPITGIEILLNSVLVADNSIDSKGLWIADDDGDALAGSTRAVGSITATLLKNSVAVAPADTAFDSCATYQLKIALPAVAAGVISSIQAITNYGSPNYKYYNYTSSNQSATYTLASSMPTACYALPYFSRGDGEYAGTSAEWERYKGFKPQSRTIASKNFPTTGFDNAFFDLTLAGTTAQDLIDTNADKSGKVYGTGSSEVYLVLSATSKANVLRVRLRGPSSSSAPVNAYTATTFKLKSGEIDVYSFTIDKWFFARKDVRGSYNDTVNPAISYCSSFSNGTYRIPSFAEYINSTFALFNIVGSSSQNHYTRSIGQGLFAEWGALSYSSTVYPDSDFENAMYWANQPYDDRWQIVVGSFNGSISSAAVNSLVATACVSP